MTSEASATDLPREAGDLTTYAISATLDVPFSTALTAVRAALGQQGFGILTEIDLAATLRSTLDVEIDEQVVLGACNPPLAHRALQAEEQIGLLLPCNVVVRSLDRERTQVEALDPAFMVIITGNAALAEVAKDAAARLRAALDSLTKG